MIYQGKARYPVKEAVLHCCAIATGQFAHMSAFQVFATVNRWHIERGWKGFGYHGLIMPDGEFYMGRPYSMIGAHVKGRNRGTLGFLLIESEKIELKEGERIEDKSFEDYYTTEQRLALRGVLRSIEGLEKVSGHNDYAPKLCPGFHVYTGDWLR